ncbi:MAG: hypothetical protein JSW23_00235 [Planctomycetota bacterium]|nr:MAG: hypothetical protein JSW23_00235 [Planctomycetota bacterium]
MKTKRIIQFTTLALALLVVGLLKFAPAGTPAQHPSFATYTPELTLLESKRAALARQLRAQARFLAETESEILTDLDAREALVAARLTSLIDQLTYAEARTIDLRSKLQAIKQTRDGNDDYGLSMRLWHNAVAAAENAEQALRDKLDEEKTAAASLCRKRTALRLLYDEFDSTEQLYAALCRRIQKLQRRPDAPPSS